MSRYTGSANKQARRVGFSLLESGKDIARKPFRPGQHGASRRRKVSNYGTQLLEKQKVKFMYGLNERQFRNTFNKAGKMAGVHGEDFLKLLESRLDNIVYRLGLARTRRGARQLVNHGHVMVNDKKVDIPSYLAKPGDVIVLREKSKDHASVLEALSIETSKPEFVSFDKKTMTGKFLRYPERNELNPEVNEALIVEFYNR